MKFAYRPKGVCSQLMEFEIEDNVIVDAKITGGCPGNTAGICRLIKGMEVDRVIETLEGTTCGSKPTSCPDQLAKALAAYREYSSTHPQL
mgnify:CR=1 FL=1